EADTVNRTREWGSFLGAVGSGYGVWKQHRRLALGGLVGLAALLSWPSYLGIRFCLARSHFRAAQAAVHRTDWAAAHEQLEASLRGWPVDPAAHLLAARVARRLERLVEAEEHLVACQRLLGEEAQAIKVERALLRVHQRDLAKVEDYLRNCIANED